MGTLVHRDQVQSGNRCGLIGKDVRKTLPDDGTGRRKRMDRNRWGGRERERTQIVYSMEMVGMGMGDDDSVYFLNIAREQLNS